MVCEEEVVNWFQGLKGHKRIPILRQLVHMCHPLELRFIASCVEDACRTDCLTMRSAELNANTQNVLKMLASPLDVEARSKIIVYLCLLNSTNKLCSRILSQKICDHDSVTQFCDDVHKQLMAGEVPSTEEQRTLDELRLLYLLASLHPSFDFIERQHYRAMCSSLNDIESELKRLERKGEQTQVESVVPKPCCDGGSQRDNASKSCSLCFSTSTYEHICKLRLLPRSGRQPEGDHENQVNVQWSTGKYSNLVIRDTQLRQLHHRLENPQLESIISQPRLPPFPHDPSEAGQMNSYLQHLQGLSAVTWPRSEPVYQFFRQLADEQEQRSRGVVRPHSVYCPRAAEVPGPPGRHPLTNGTAETAHKLTMPLPNGTVEADDSSETSPAVLDEDAEVKSCTIYNSNITNGRPGPGSPLPGSRLTPARSASPERPPAGWSSRAASHSPGPPLTNGLVRSRPPADSSRGPVPRRRPPRQSDSRSGSVDKEEPPRVPAAPVSPAAGGGVPGVSANATTGTATGAGTARDRVATKAATSPRAMASSAAVPAAYTAPAPAPAPAPASVAVPGTAVPGAVPGAIPGTVIPGATPLQPRIICTQTAGLIPAPGVPLPAAVAGVCGRTHTIPTYSAVTAQNATAGTPGALVDGVRCGGASDVQLVYTALPAGSPPPGGPVPGYRLPPRTATDLLSAGSSPSPPAPAGSPAATLPPPVPAHTLSSYLPAYSSRPPPPLPQPQPQLGIVYPAGFVQHGFPSAHEIPAFYTYGPHGVQYAAVPPPRAAPPPATRPVSCYNCGHGHSPRYCPMDMHDPSQQNQFSLKFASPISEN